MAWTTPRAWTNGELVTAALLNAHVRDNLQYLYDVLSGSQATPGGVAVTGNLSATGTLSVTGAATLSGGIAGSLTIANGLTVSANGILVSAGGLVVSSGGLAVSASGATIVGNSSITGTLGVSNTLTVSGGGAAITGNTMISGGTLTVGGTVTAGSTLTVSSGGASISGNSSVTGTLGVSNTLTVSAGGAAITGNSTIAGTLSLSGASPSLTIGSTAFQATNAAEVGIGVGAQSGYALYVQKSGSALVSLVAGAGSPVYLDMASGTKSSIFRLTTTNGLQIGTLSNDPVEVWSNSARRGYINNTGEWAIGAPTSVQSGDGKLNVQTDIYKNGTAYTNPDYVLEHWATGRIERFKDRDGAADYPGVLPLLEVERFARAHLHLPRIRRDVAGLFERGDMVLEKLEELFVHAINHEHRLRNLEARQERA